MVVDIKLVKPHIGISTDTTIGTVPHYFDELPSEDEERLGNLFKALDVDGNGKIDIHDLSVALQEFGLHHKYAQSFIERADANQSKDVSLAEFIQYVREHEKNLRLGFSHIDKNQDGKVDLEELIMAFKELGVDVEVHEARKLLQRMDQDGSLEISFNEWRDFLLYAPSTDIHDLIKFWRHSTKIEDQAEEKCGGYQWRQTEENKWTWFSLDYTRFFYSIMALSTVTIFSISSNLRNYYFSFVGR